MDYLLVLVRGLISFLALVVFLRLLGKQQLSELSLIDFVISITIGSIASSATVDTDNPSIYTVFGIIVWSVLALLLMHTQLYNRWFNVIMHGQPKVLVEGGRIDKHALRQEKLTFDDLLMLLRKAGAFDLRDVEAAVLEIDGTVSVLKRAQQAPLTPEDLNVSTPYRGLPTVLILDGEVKEENLQSVGLSLSWLREQIKAQGAGDIGKVNYCSIDTTGTLYVDAESHG